MIRFAFQSFGDVELSTGEARLRVNRASASPGGVDFNLHNSSISSLGDPMENQFVPWAAIDSVRVRRAGGAGPVFGVLAGLFVGGSIAVAEASYLPWGGVGEQPSAAPVIVATLVGGTLGWLADHAGPWHRVYP